MPSTLHVHGVSFSFGPHTVLTGVELTVPPKMRLGILGPNGVGKSTLLGILSGRFVPDTGSVTFLPPSSTVGELRQETERLGDETVTDYLQRRTGVAVVQHELDQATISLSQSIPGCDDRYSDALDRWLSIGAADFEARCAEVVASLGLTQAVLDSSMATLSGGQAARVGLAAILLSRFDVLLLDEPTNDLDFAGLEQLERFVLDFSGALVVVSHDRAFMDRVVTHVAEIDEHTHRVSMFAGGWAAFLEEREVAKQHAQRAFENYDTQKSDLSSRAQREREWAHQGVNKEKKSPRDNDKVGAAYRKEQTEQLAARARRTERAIDRLEVVEKPRESWQLQFSIAVAPRAGAVVARLNEAVVTHGNFVLGPVTIEIGWGETIGIVGANGAGKTTLIHALWGRVELDSGNRWQGPAVVIGEIDQARQQFMGDTSLINTFVQASGATSGDARGVLAKFNLGAQHVMRPAISLSPGERTRAGLALLQITGVNTLVLDEPTNHLDLPAIEQLEMAINAFPGTVLLVTHDRRLLDEINFTRILRISDGKVTEEVPPAH